MKGRQNVVGTQVQAIRLRQEMKQELLSAKCGILGWDISRGTLAKVEAQIRCVSDRELWILAKALKVPLDNLYPPGYRGE
jgi:transcriptional regulator with XRE-family HTH domain